MGERYEGLAVPFDVHFVRYRRIDAGRVLAWCVCGWSMCGHRDAVHAASATHDLDRAAMAEREE